LVIYHLAEVHGVQKLFTQKSFQGELDMLPHHPSNHVFDYLWKNFHPSLAPNEDEFVEPEPTNPEELEELEQEKEEVLVEKLNAMEEIEEEDKQQQ
jgi:hypothetical protein